MKPFHLDALRGRRALLTGHTGFKGSWLAIWLNHLGARVWGLALAPPTTPSNFEVSRVAELVEAHLVADVRDPAAVREAVVSIRPDVIFHVAAQALVLESYQRPIETFEVNTIGTANLLEAVRLSGQRCVVIAVTSDKCYDLAAGHVPHDEDDPLGGSDPYSASKGAAEIVVSSYRRSFFDPDDLDRHGVALASVRAGNVIGGGDWGRDRIIPDIVRSLAAGEPTKVRNPTAIRPWQHVVEPLGGYLLLASRLLEECAPELCGAWNFGPQPGLQSDVAELVTLFLDAWGSGTWVHQSVTTDTPSETEVLLLSIDKARRQLGWQPRWDLAEAVRRTARWYRRLADDSQRDMIDECLTDIEAYQKRSDAEHG